MGSSSQSQSQGQPSSMGALEDEDDEELLDGEDCETMSLPVNAESMLCSMGAKRGETRIKKSENRVLIYPFQNNMGKLFGKK